MMDKRDAVIVAYGRSAYAKAFKGSFANCHPVEYAAQVLKGVLEKVPGVVEAGIDDFVVGCAMPFGVTGRNVAKLILQRAELPDSIPAVTVNRFCSSGLQTLSIAANAIRCGEIDIAVAGGVESMTKASEVPNESTVDPWLVEHRPGVYAAMGVTAENVAQKYQISREDMDLFSCESHQKAAAAWDENFFAEQIVPVEVTMIDGSTKIVAQDEGIRRDTTIEKLSALKPCFLENGQVTAGNSSQMTDGAGFVVLMAMEKAEQLGLKPIARLVQFAVAGVPAELMGIGPIAAVPKVMERSGLSLADMDVIELNEAFASQSLACIRELNLDQQKVNPVGGAIALGHPLGASGAMLVCKALTWLQKHNGRYGLVTMCIGGGQGAAGILELL